MTEGCGKESYLNRKISNSVAFEEDLYFFRNSISMGENTPNEAYAQLQEGEVKTFRPVLASQIETCFENIAKGRCNKFPAPPQT